MVPLKVLSFRSTTVNMKYFSSAAKGMNVGFIGIGNMGLGMSKNLVKKGYNVCVYDSDSTKMDQLKGCDFKLASDLCEIAKTSDCLLTMLPSGPIVLNAYSEMMNHLRKEALAIDCSTIDPLEAMTLSKNLKELGINFIDAPVSGGVSAAEQGLLTFMVGGEKETALKAEEILLTMGKKVFYCGNNGAGQAAKICNNLLLAISMIGVSEAMLLGGKLGLSPGLLREIINSSSGRCWSSEVYSPVPNTMPNVPSNNQFKPGFSAKIMLKDLMLASNAAKRANVTIPMGSTAATLYQDLDKSKFSNLDFSVVYEFLKTKS